MDPRGTHGEEGPGTLGAFTLVQAQWCAKKTGY